MSNYTYAIADLHGRYDLFMQAMHRIAAHGSKHADSWSIVLTGDYIDRGPQSRELIETLMEFDEKKWIMPLMGNHEWMMTYVYNHPTPKNIKWWLKNGGGRTLVSYGFGVFDQITADSLKERVPESHIRWMEELKYIIVDKHRLFVHAGVEPHMSLKSHSQDVVLWKLYKDNMWKGYEDKHVVHGHHQHEDGPVLWRGRTNLDTLAWHTGRLVVGVFDNDQPGGPIELLEVIDGKDIPSGEGEPLSRYYHPSWGKGLRVYGP